MSFAPVYRNEYFHAVPCRDCDVPGYLILLPSSSEIAFEELPKEALALLGSTFAALEGAVASITRCERVYFLRLSEGTKSIHFHVFPRTEALGNQFRDEMKFTEDGLNGELLFYWARKRFKVASPAALSLVTMAMADQIRERLSAR